MIVFHENLMIIIKYTQKPRKKFRSFEILSMISKKRVTFCQFFVFLPFRNSRK